VTAPSGFFAYDKPGPDRPVSSWLVAARSQCRIVDLWHAATVTLLAKTRAHAQSERMLDGVSRHPLRRALSRAIAEYVSWRFGYDCLLILGPIVRNAATTTGSTICSGSCGIRTRGFAACGRRGRASVRTARTSCSGSDY